MAHGLSAQNVVLDVINFSSYHLKPALLTEFLKNKKTFVKKMKRRKEKQKEKTAPLKRTLFVCVLGKAKSLLSIYCQIFYRIILPAKKILRN